MYKKFYLVSPVYFEKESIVTGRGEDAFEKGVNRIGVYDNESFMSGTSPLGVFKFNDDHRKFGIHREFGFRRDVESATEETIGAVLNRYKEYACEHPMNRKPETIEDRIHGLLEEIADIAEDYDPDRGLISSDSYPAMTAVVLNFIKNNPSLVIEYIETEQENDDGPRSS